jgi:signal transduction histidine kinase
MVRTDIQLLKICIGNLIDNALKYGREGGLIQISIIDRGHVSGQVEISVTNELGGLGIPDTAKIFDKYYRDPKAYEKTGSGLGLYLVKNFVGLLSGDIQCHVRDSHITLSMHLPVNKL